VVIDFHTHIFSPSITKDRTEYLSDPCFAHLYSSPKAKLATAEELITSMDKDEVDVSVVLNIGWTSQALCTESNSYILEAIARYPDRLVGFCAIQPTAGEAALAEIERCAQGGARGVGELRSDIQGYGLDDEKLWAPIVELMRKHDLLLLTHSSEPVGHTYPGKGTITPGALYQLPSNFPDLCVICAHWGGGLPFYALMPEVSSILSNTFFDTAASPFLYRPQIYQQVAEIVGADKILFGSDYPLLTQSRLIREIESAGLTQETKAMILGGNARRLLGWKGSAVS